MWNGDLTQQDLWSGVPFLILAEGGAGWGVMELLQTACGLRLKAQAAQRPCCRVCGWAGAGPTPRLAQEVAAPSCLQGDRPCPPPRKGGAWPSIRAGGQGKQALNTPNKHKKKARQASHALLTHPHVTATR